MIGLTAPLDLGEDRPVCSQGPALRALIAKAERDARRKPKRASISRELIEAGKAHCIAKCGGCELTRAPTISRKDCRRAVDARLQALADLQGEGWEVDATCSDVAARCRDCGRCPKFAAGISFMLLDPTRRPPVVR